MELKSEENTYLYLKNEYGKILNEMIFVIAKTGWGKGLSTEGIAEEFHDAGYTVIVIADPKQEVEFGYAQFLPEERYHLNHLRLIGKMPQTKQVKIYHKGTQKLAKKIDVEWSTNKPSVASVKNGSITAHRIGEATVKANSGEFELPIEIIIKKI